MPCSIIRDSRTAVMWADYHERGACRGLGSMWHNAVIRIRELGVSKFRVDHSYHNCVYFELI